jgi:hypothetical protein
MSSADDEQNKTSSNYPDWFQEWLDEFMQAAGVETLPDYKARYYPDWYRQVSPWMQTYGKNLWWESAFVPYSFAASYTWSALNREVSQGYYEAMGDRYVNPANYLGQASAAYYRQQIAATPALVTYQMSKFGSYMLPGAGLWRGFAFAPMGFAQNVTTGAAEAPYIRQAVTNWGAAYTYQQIQSRATLYPFQEPTPAELYASGAQWTAGQSSLLLMPGLARGLYAGITQGGFLPASQVESLMLRTWDWPIGGEAGLGYLENEAIGNVRVGTGLGSILRSGWRGMGGWSGLARGFGFGLLQMGAQLTAEELAYIYNMGQAGLGGQLYSTRERALGGLERWALALGSWGVGAYLSAGAAAVGPALLGLAGAAALGMQVTADVLTRQKANIPWNEPLAYTRSRAFGGEFQINPRLIDPNVGRRAGLEAALVAGTGWFGPTVPTVGGAEAAFGLYGQGFSGLNYRASGRYVPPGYVYDPQGNVIPNPNIQGSPWTRLYGTYSYQGQTYAIPPSSPVWWAQQMQIQSGNLFWEQRTGADAWWAWQRGNVYPSQGAYLDRGALPTVAEYNRYWSQPQGASSWLGPGGGIYSPQDLMMNYYSPRAPTSWWGKYYSQPGQMQLVPQYVYDVEGNRVFSGTSDWMYVVDSKFWSLFNQVTPEQFFKTGYMINGIMYPAVPGEGLTRTSYSGAVPTSVQVTFGDYGGSRYSELFRKEKGFWYSGAGEAGEWTPQPSRDSGRRWAAGTAYQARPRYRPQSLVEQQAYFESTMAGRNYLYYPSTYAWAQRIGVTDLPKSPQGRYGVWTQGYASSEEAWLYEKGAYAKYADAPSIEDLSSAVDANMIGDEVMWLAENSDLSNVIGAEFYRIGRETQ